MCTDGIIVWMVHAGATLCGIAVGIFVANLKK